MGKEFTLEEARALVPRVRQLLESARDDLSQLTARLKQANDALLEVEWELRELRLAGGQAPSPFAADARWKRAANRLSRSKTRLRERTRTWLAEIQETGAELRDLARGLVDFPGRYGDLEVFWCWHLGEETIAHWHGRAEGFANRKSVRSIPAQG